MNLTNSEKAEYKRLMTKYKTELKYIRDSIDLSEEDKRLQIAIVNQQIASLKEQFVKRLEPKEKFSRAKTKQDTQKLISNYYKGTDYTLEERE